MREQDSLQRFMFEHASIRGEIAHLQETYQTIMEQRSYPPMVKNLLGEALVSCLLLAGSIKFEGDLSLQFQGDKRLPLLLVQCDHNLHLRAFAKCEENLQDIDYAEAFLKGQMVLTINQYNQTSAYQSIVPIQSTSMGENLMTYFAQSEQIASRVWLAVNEGMAAGMLLQLMPGQDSLEREHFWEYAVQLGQTVSEQELLSLDNQTLLHRLYHETELRLFDSRSPSFQCRCTEEKMKQVLTILGEDEAKELLKERGEIEVTCDFCNKKYSFDPIDVTMLFHKPH
ncbi:Hsp33 family molecular chaperone HslO [Legionella jordanis]|uniref:Heat shock protein 33, redox regulated chaperonin n=1 Tax=Legionella jordanis TaxID=456 RepID=A0A0W0VDX5_9GAMM|nr:Hsp33 family molecular chaperone HslO [Legionella jordanis]KTD18093.1 heat shock protein 33, redox regulated chaperonin [Legionella jordanis]RMX00594.1 Hsp33 family molecular chaperone HslO [Legionella jordanis]RMX21290.1 Hsp33 family molecular chaperone HslO [Legionella jordanis]VEH13815.1 heat shock protein 33, redox regulated chaperonin [Legionella jordanis]HAT8714196.1 Hsp33 family molecular chaperone HslO [Legionella jordanis]